MEHLVTFTARGARFGLGARQGDVIPCGTWYRLTSIGQTTARNVLRSRGFVLTRSDNGRFYSVEYYKGDN